MEENELEEELQEQHKNRVDYIKPWQFKKGQSGNPKGRPPGKSLKERAKSMLNAMTEEEEQEFLAGIDKRTIWEMAEGKAKQDLTADIKAEINVIIPKPVADAFKIDDTNINSETGRSNQEPSEIQSS